MSNVAELEPRWQQVLWQPNIPGAAKTPDIQIDCFATPGATVYLYGGFGEEERATEHGVRVLRDLGIAATGVVLRFDDLEPTAANIDRVVKEAPVAVATEFSERRGDRFYIPDDFIAHSQSAGIIPLAAAEAPERFGAMSLIAPVGLNRESLGSTDAQRRRHFLWRLAITNNLTSSMNPFLDYRNIAAPQEVVHRAVDDIRGSRLDVKLDYALSQDIAPAIALLAKDHDIRIFIGEKDKVFRVDEVEPRLRAIGCASLLQVTQGAHAPFLNRDGTMQLQTAAEWIKSLDLAA